MNIDDVDIKIKECKNAFPGDLQNPYVEYEQEYKEAKPKSVKHTILLMENGMYRALFGSKRFTIFAYWINKLKLFIWIFRSIK
jgi:hypothetical protein